MSKNKKKRQSHSSSPSSNPSKIDPWQNAKPGGQRKQAPASLPSSTPASVSVPILESLPKPVPDEIFPVASESIPEPVASAESLPELVPKPAPEPSTLPESTPSPETDQSIPDTALKPETSPESLIETLEDFITHAYTLKKTQKLGLDKKTADLLSTQPVLEADTLQRLLRLAQQDRLLATPRQLLRVVRAATAYPSLRNAIREFVRSALLAHRLFQALNLESCIQNQPGAPSLESALSLIAKHPLETVLPVDQEGEPPDRKVLEELRLNAIRTLALWLAEVQHLKPSDLGKALYHALWQPAAEDGRAVDESIILTEIKDLTGVGLACHSFVQQAAEQAQAAQAAALQVRRVQEEAHAVHEEFNTTRSMLSVLEQRIAELEGQLQEQQTAYQTLELHLRDQMENLRTRVLRRLKDDERLLSEGLVALRRPTPKVHVMDDHAERVLDSLHNEIKKLEGG